MEGKRLQIEVAGLEKLHLPQAIATLMLNCNFKRVAVVNKGYKSILIFAVIL